MIYIRFCFKQRIKLKHEAKIKPVDVGFTTESHCVCDIGEEYYTGVISQQMSAALAECSRLFLSAISKSAE